MTLEDARERVKRAWEDWDEEELKRELAPWPKQDAVIAKAKLIGSLAIWSSYCVPTFEEYCAYCDYWEKHKPSFIRWLLGY